MLCIGVIWLLLVAWDVALIHENWHYITSGTFTFWDVLLFGVDTFLLFVLLGIPIIVWLRKSKKIR